MAGKRLLVFVLLTLFCIHVAAADQFPMDSVGTGSENETNTISDIVPDSGRGGSFPFKLKGKTLLKLGSIALLTGILIKNDERLFRRTEAFRGRNLWVNTVSPKVTLLGDTGVNLGLIGGLYLGGHLFKNPELRQTAQLSLKSLLYATLTVSFLKQIAGRQRPEAGNGVDRWLGPGNLLKNGFTSFPSGHTITAWSVATVIAHRYNKTIWIPALCYSMATMVGLSRVAQKKHWYSDVFIGSVLGFVIGRYVVKHQSKRVSLFPTFTKGGMGLNVGYYLD